MKRCADKRAKASPANRPGKAVLVQQQKVNQLSTPFSPEPMVVNETKGSMISAKHGDGYTVSGHFNIQTRLSLLVYC